MRVLLAALNTKFVHTNIALRYLYETVRDRDVCLREFTINEPIGKVLSAIMLERPDVVAFSVYLWNVEEVLKLSQSIKKIDERIKIVLGGPEVTYQSVKILNENSYIDFVIVGEGEEVFSELIDFIEDYYFKDLKKEVLSDLSRMRCLRHVSFQSIFEMHVGSMAMVCDTDKIPRIAKGIADDYDGRIVYFETVRGCPYNCSYCLSSTIKGIRPFDMERVKDELLILMNAKVRLIKFVDRTFNYDKKRALEIWRFLLEHNISSEFHFEISAHLIDEEILEFLESVPENTFRLEIGVQSTNPETIKSINRSTDFKVIKRVMKRIMSKGNITTHLDLIAGLPFEGYERFKESFNDVYALRPTELQLGFLKLLSGCEITENAGFYRYQYMDYPPYEVLKNEFISFEELVKLKNVEEMVDVFYNSGRYKNSFEFVLEKFGAPFDLYLELSVFAKENGYMDRKISAEEWFDVLAKFYYRRKFDDFSEFVQSLKIDHFENFGNKRRRGLFMFSV